MFFQFVFAIVLLLDQFTKLLALQFLNETGSIPVIPKVFYLTLVYNPGVAFGIFRHHPAVLFVVVTISLIFLFLWGSRKADLIGLQRLGLAMILGGAVGNWIDRARFGAVIDFLDFRVWPVFNIADSAITIGVSIFVILILRKKPQ